MTVLVQQRTDFDCSIACLSMATGRAYEDVIAVVGDLFHPVEGMRLESQALERLGFKAKYQHGLPTGDFVSLYRDWCLHPALFRTWIWGRRSLVTVPSLNIADQNVKHMVYYDGSDVFDPSLKRRYESWEHLLPDYAVIFREGVLP